MTQTILPGVGEGQPLNDNFKRIGKQLQAARKERGLRMTDVARELRISADYLRWLESGDFDQLPAPTYVSGFLRSYGKFLGLDGADLARRFYSINGDASSTMDYKLPVTAGPPQRSAPAVASLFVVLALVGYGGWYWISGPTTPDAAAESELAVGEIDSKQPALMEKNAIGQRFETLSQVPLDTLPGDDASVIVSNDDLSGKTPLVTTTDGDDNVDTENASGTINLTSVAPSSSKSVVNDRDAGVMVFNSPTLATTSSYSTDGDAATQVVTQISRIETFNNTTVTPDSFQRPPPSHAAAVATSRDPDQEVTIRATASSWVEIVRDDGTAVLKKLLKTGETYVIDDGRALYLSTGNAGGIELVADGNNIISIGAIGEIVRDLPLEKNRLRERF